MTRAEIYREVLRLGEQLEQARRRVKDAQERARRTGVRVPSRDFAAMWDDIHRLEREVAATRLRLSTAAEAAAERFVAIVRAEHPAVFAEVASRAGVER